MNFNTIRSFVLGSSPKVTRMPMRSVPNGSPTVNLPTCLGNEAPSVALGLTNVSPGRTKKMTSLSSIKRQLRISSPYALNAVAASGYTSAALLASLRNWDRSVSEGDNE